MYRRHPLITYIVFTCFRIVYIVKAFAYQSNIACDNINNVQFPERIILYTENGDPDVTNVLPRTGTCMIQCNAMTLFRFRERLLYNE